MATSADIVANKVELDRIRMLPKDLLKAKLAELEARLYDPKRADLASAYQPVLYKLEVVRARLHAWKLVPDGPKDKSFDISINAYMEGAFDGCEECAKYVKFLGKVVQNLSNPEPEGSYGYMGDRKKDEA